MNPQISNISEEDDVYKFTINGINVSIANAVRRIILSEIPINVFHTETYDDNKCTIEINNPPRLHNEIIKQDYLMLDHSNFKNKFNNIHIIGNPPFGRQSSFAIQFIKKSCEFCDSLSFILPKSFKKDSLKKHFPLRFHLIFESDLPDKSFLVDGVEHNVPCVFQIWQKKMFKRELVILVVA
jgi:hypothetical protein